MREHRVTRYDAVLRSCVFQGPFSCLIHRLFVVRINGYNAIVYRRINVAALFGESVGFFVSSCVFKLLRAVLGFLSVYSDLRKRWSFLKAFGKGNFGNRREKVKTRDVSDFQVFGFFNESLLRNCFFFFLQHVIFLDSNIFFFFLQRTSIVCVGFILRNTRRRSNESWW